MKLFIFLFISISLYSQTKTFYPDSKIKVKLPGVVRVNDSLFCDITEVTNLEFRVYLFDTKKFNDRKNHIKGNQILDEFVDKKVFLDSMSYGAPDYSNYWIHPSYNLHPTVGITQVQAINFSKWKTDIVFREFLIKMKVIPKVENMDSTTFTIEDYFGGKFNGIKPDTNYLFYFEYSLPTLDEWKKAYSFNYDKFIWSEERSKSYKSNQDIPFITSNFNTKSKLPISDLEYNVSEWLNSQNNYIGQNFKDTISLKNVFQIFTSEKATSFIGFRNVGKWKKWEGEIVR